MITLEELESLPVNGCVYTGIGRPLVFPTVANNHFTAVLFNRHEIKTDFNYNKNIGDTGHG